MPEATRLAARRGFIRTATQALEVGIPTAAVTGGALSGADPATIAWAVLAAVLSAFGAGARSYFSILSKGIPEDYLPEAQLEISDAQADAIKAQIGESVFAASNYEYGNDRVVKRFIDDPA